MKRTLPNKVLISDALGKKSYFVINLQTFKLVCTTPLKRIAIQRAKEDEQNVIVKGKVLTVK